MGNVVRFTLAAAYLVLFAGCAEMPATPVTTVQHVDINRFMGPWYIIASIPSSVEKNAYNAIESYALQPDGSIATTFTFNDNDFDGDAKRYTPRGYVMDSTNAVWGMQFIWPFKADYRISYLADDYHLTVVAREKRDYVWIMARTPEISDAEYQRSVEFVGGLGYDVSKLRRVPQRWSH